MDTRRLGTHVCVCVCVCVCTALVVEVWNHVYVCISIYTN